MEKVKILLKCIYDLYGEEIFEFLEEAALRTDTNFDDYAVSGLRTILEWFIEDGAE